MSPEQHEPEREARRADRERARDERRTLREQIRRSLHGTFPRELGEHIGRSIRDSMSFNFDLGDMAEVGGEEYSEIVERDFTVGELPRLSVRNISGQTRITVGPNRTVHVRARKRVRGTSEERAKRLLENVEVRMDQSGDDITLRPHLYEQDRGWVDMFRGGRVAVDFDIAVPRQIRIESHTVSGDVGIVGTRGPLEVQSVSGDVTLDDVQGPTRLKTVSGDARCVDFAGQLESNSVSGDLNFDRCLFHGSDITTVSGDLRFDGDLAIAREHRIKTISGDVSLALVGSSYDIKFKTMSGDLESSSEARIVREERRDKHVIIGAGETKITVKTVSGDLETRTTAGSVPVSGPDAAAEQPRDPEQTAPMTPGFDTTRADVRDLLERVARGELDVESAAAALDDARLGG
ncbi:MAG TPA: DUF4097 family beta strand repeat-containing protein [Candidatus Limnocylindria bacterium]|nr:DUF4097 family beta strand repeat-containing protein [Candidatus Limnocylindria bacterium]